MKNRYHGGNLTQAARAFGLKEEEFLDFSANINPLGPSPRVWPALRKALDRIVHYPEPQGIALKTQLAKYLDVKVSQIVLGNGGAELIYLMSQFFRPRRIIVTAPTFGEYGQGIKNPLIRSIDLEREKGFALDLDKFATTIQTGDLIFLGNPNNPTGVLSSRQDILSLAKLAKERDSVLIVDEAFMDFVQENQSIAGEVENYPNLIVLGSLTKIFALPGLRLGYLIGGSELTQELELLLPPWRINTLALEAGVISLQDKEYLIGSKELVRTERAFLLAELQNLGLEPLPGAANFLLVNSSFLGITGQEWQEYLGPKGVLIRLCHSFQNLNEYYFRIAVRNRRENEKLLGLLARKIANQ